MDDYGNSGFAQEHGDLVAEPYDLDAEAAVLRAAMAGNDESLTYVTGYLEDEDFFRSRNRLLFAALVQAAEDQTAVDPVVLSSYLPASMREHVREVYEEARQDDENLVHWVRTVRNYSHQRKMLDLARETIHKLGSPRWADAVWEFYDGMVEIVAGHEASGATTKEVSNLSEEIMALVDSSIERQGVIGIRSGIWPVDMHFMGLCKGHVGILAGRPNEGKSGFAGQIMLNVATQDYRVLTVSTEMMARDMYLRLAFARSGVGWDSFQHGAARSERGKVEKALDDMMKLPMFIDDADRHTVASIRRSVIRHRPDLLIIDYTQQVRPAATYRDSRDREVASIADGIRSIAKMADIPVLALAQMNRAIEGRGVPDPRLSDLRDSGVVENNADWVMFIQNAHTWDRRRPQNEVILKGRKNRHGIKKVWDESMFLDDSMMWLGSAEDLRESATSSPASAPRTQAEKDGDDFEDVAFDLEED